MRAAVSVALGLLASGGNVLLLRRRREPYAGLWSLPGGKVEPGESPEEAVVRELREGLGWEVACRGLCLVVHERIEGAAGDGEWHLSIFRCTPPAGAPLAPDCAWFPLDRLDRVPMIPTDRLFVAEGLACPEGAPAPRRRAVVALEGGTYRVVSWG